VTREEFRDRLADYVRTLAAASGAPAPDDDTPLFESGLLNSMRVLDLIGFLEARLGARVPDPAIRLANFRSIGAMVHAFAPGHADAR
jgi:acyl carrier protein